MNEFPLFLLAGAALFALGFHALMACSNLIRKILAINIMGNGIFLIFIATAARSAGPVPDPVPQAMVLTGIVVAVCATAFALALADRVRAATGELKIPETSGSDDER